MLKTRIPKPVLRKLRVFAVDPGLTARFETAVLNEMTLSIPWEELTPGPEGEYLKVVDADEHGRQLHFAVDLNQSQIVAEDGLAPSDGNPQFRQQMAYAVAMRTIRNFERALGRVVHWSALSAATTKNDRQTSEVAYRPKLTLFPHFMEEPNAFYSPPENQLKFGYFLPDQPLGGQSSGVCVFTVLSQDVIAHEVTHAILIGMNIGVQDESHPDTLAFHEAFADLIALFQHFWNSDVLRMEIGAIQGNLEQRSTLGAVALQFGQAIGQPDGLRNALGYTKDGNWHARLPDPKRYETETEPHARGDILVGAVFGAFRKIYESRVADLRRIASKGTGVLAPGTLHPDLVGRFAAEASKSARHVLDMCIRALDYMPPMQFTFGDYLRAIITADHALYPIDSRHYRVAFAESFRSYGIGVPGVTTLSSETFLWPTPKPRAATKLVSDYAVKKSPSNLPSDREGIWRTLRAWREEFAGHLRSNARRLGYRLGPIDLRKDFEVLSFHPRERSTYDQDLCTQWVIKLVQPPLPPNTTTSMESNEADTVPAAISASRGCTLVIDADTGVVQHQIDRTSRGGSSTKRRSKAGSSKLLETTNLPRTTLPRERRIRVFAFDPSLGVRLETAGINEVVLRIPWERDLEGNEILQPGPIGEYVEVVDRDPASRCYYEPIDLNDPQILAQDGLPPSESNPQFHQQMVYAVAMRTIRNFEQALGRLALWSPRRFKQKGPGNKRTFVEEYVGKLRIYPHALREANAFYSPQKKGLLMGYFPADSEAGDRSTPLTVFTCLSHDIVAHEITHALLDGMHRRFTEASNPDVPAFHEAFADIVALFQHFSLPEVLRHQVAKTRGDLASQNSLGELAQQFGRATGKRGALRSAIGAMDETGTWRPLDPQATTYGSTLEPHDRGAILVAAVFEAFLTIYKSKIADLLRIASEGSGILPEGHLHPDLVNRLADEAARAAQRVLYMCIRALDYCPPVDITFGDYLRALITADFEFDPIDENNRRVAFVEAFRRYGIVPEDVRTLSVEGLLWRPASAAPDENADFLIGVVRRWGADVEHWRITRDRKALWELMRNKRRILHSYLASKHQQRSAAILSGLDPTRPFEVHSIRPSFRIDWQEKRFSQWIIELTQRIPQFIDSEDERRQSAEPDYYFRGGCTLLVDAETGRVRYTIRKRLDDARRERQRRYVLEDSNQNLAATYFSRSFRATDEPFAMLHRF